MKTKLSSRSSFPIFQRHPRLVYMDNAATTQTPQEVLDAMNEYYTTFRSNIHRGVYTLAEKASSEFDHARKTIADFIHAEPEEIIFTRNATESLNLAVHFLLPFLSPRAPITASVLDHHSLFLPLQRASQKTKTQRPWHVIPLDSHQENVNLNHLLQRKNLKGLVGLTHVSNTLGSILPLEKIIPEIRRAGGISIVDAAQSIAHFPIDVKKIPIDALAFSGHKMYGPTGIGILYIAKRFHQKIQPFFLGGGMVQEATLNHAQWLNMPNRLEAGTPPIAESLGLAASVQFIQRLGWKKIQHHEKHLTRFALEKLSHIPGITIFGPRKQPHAPVISFAAEGVHPHDLASFLDQEHIAIRAGHHCTKPLMTALGVGATSRISFSIYNTLDDVNRFLVCLQKALKILR